MSDGGSQVPGPGEPVPGWAPTAEHAAFPATQALPQQLPAPAPGQPPHQPPATPWRVAGLGVLVVGALGGLVVLLLVAFGVFDDDSDSVETVDGTTRPTPLPADLVPAIAETVFRCPDGAMGAPSVDDPSCVIAESTELVPAVEAAETTYRCPAGTTGSPNEARPECARSSAGAVDAIATTTLRCPQGATGSPNAAEPFCVAADQSVRVAVEAIVVHDCDDDARLDESVDPPACVRMVDEQRRVPAVEDISFECPADVEAEPTPDPEDCRLELDEPAACALPVQLVEDGPDWSCFGDLVGTVDDGSCPAGSTPDPERPASGDGTDCYESEPACERGRYESSTERCVRSAVELATVVVELVCPLDVTAPAATVVGDECDYTASTEVSEPSTETTEYRCPEGSRGGQGGSPDAVCVVTEDAPVRALAVTTYACPSGSTGSPTAAIPTCTSLTTETVPATVETEVAYRCPDGTVGEPTAEDPTCARTRGAVTVPASVVTEFSCPVGASGAPTFTDPFCTTTE